jgi:UDP-N-acetylglucosamine 2-epimerase (non-hydrolysing)
MNIQISTVVGARPNFMKIGPIFDEARRRPRLQLRLIHTGQHYSSEMSDSFFQDLSIPAPDINLGVGGGSHTSQTAAIMQRLEPELDAHRPDLLLVVGDVNSTMAAALVAAKAGIPIAHIEAGLRSFDRGMPEEINRIVTDALSDYLFASEPSGVTNLRAEGVPESKIFLVGNVMIDTLLRFRGRAAKTRVWERLGLQPRSYAVVTLHRPANVDDTAKLGSLLEVLAEIARTLPVVFPVHPRTRQRMEAIDFPREGILLAPPMGYLEFLGLMGEARMILTDSGGIQEESTLLGVPCLTMRRNTERPITIEKGTNRLVGDDPATILRIAVETLQQPLPDPGGGPELWDGKAAARILDVIEGKFPE